MVVSSLIALRWRSPYAFCLSRSISSLVRPLALASLSRSLSLARVSVSLASPSCHPKTQAQALPPVRPHRLRRQQEQQRHQRSSLRARSTRLSLCGVGVCHDRALSIALSRSLSLSPALSRGVAHVAYCSTCIVQRTSRRSARSARTRCKTFVRARARIPARPAGVSLASRERCVWRLTSERGIGLDCMASQNEDCPLAWGVCNHALYVAERAHSSRKYSLCSHHRLSLAPYPPLFATVQPLPLHSGTPSCVVGLEARRIDDRH